MFKRKILARNKQEALKKVRKLTTKHEYTTGHAVPTSAKVVQKGKEYEVTYYYNYKKRI